VTHLKSAQDTMLGLLVMSLASPSIFTIAFEHYGFAVFGWNEGLALKSSVRAQRKFICGILYPNRRECLGMICLGGGFGGCSSY
jgi:hypothetical protein